VEKALISRISGTDDILPTEYYRREKIIDTLKDCFESFGYQGIEVPIIEYLELLLRKSGEEILSKMYIFEDRGRRKLCLRPEMTPSIVRAYLQGLQKARMPLRLYYFGSCFRYDKQQRGRYRQFTHAGVELLGAEGSKADAEVIKLACEGLEQLGLRTYKLHIGSIGLLLELLKKYRLKNSYRDLLLGSLEALGKGEIKREDLGKKLKNIDSREEAKKKFQKVLDFVEQLSNICGLPGEVFRRVDDLLREYHLDTGLLKECQDVIHYLDLHGLDWNRAVVDFGFSRGLQYYTGVIFEIHCHLLGTASQICGGGRYDELVTTLGGKIPTPAIGFSYGLERIKLALEEENKESTPGGIKSGLVDVRIAPIGDVYAYALQVAEALRRENLRVEMDILGKKPGKNAEDAQVLGIPYVVFLGSEEASRKVIKVKSLAQGEEEILPFQEEELRSWCQKLKAERMNRK